MSTTKPDKATTDLKAVQDKIAAWPEPFRSIGTQLHETILAAGPKVKPRIWYGMPGYAAGRSTPAEPGSPTAEALHLLASWAATGGGAPAAPLPAPAEGGRA